MPNSAKNLYTQEPQSKSLILLLIHSTQELNGLNVILSMILEIKPTVDVVGPSPLLKPFPTEFVFLLDKLNKPESPLTTLAFVLLVMDAKEDLTMLLGDISNRVVQSLGSIILHQKLSIALTTVYNHAVYHKNHAQLIYQHAQMLKDILVSNALINAMLVMINHGVQINIMLKILNISKVNHK